MAKARIVIDTNVVVSSLRSIGGTSFGLMRLVEKGDLVPILTVPLILEYEEVLLRVAPELGLTSERVTDFLDALCAVGEECPVFFLWRPLLKDADDDFVLEAAVAGQSDYLVTFNTRDFAGAEDLGVQVVHPRQVLELCGGTHEHDQPESS